MLFGEKAILKERFKKAYRHPELEKRLSRSRLVQEVRCLNKAAKLGVRTPAVLFVQIDKLRIYVEYIQGLTMKDFIKQNDEEESVALCAKLGAMLCRLHNGGVIHGDLTTSNVIVRAKDTQLHLIDFGLARSNANDEDKAVDLYVLERAFTSTHPESDRLFAEVLEGYRREEAQLAPSHKSQMWDKFDKVQRRGRKRVALG